MVESSPSAGERLGRERAPYCKFFLAYGRDWVGRGGWKGAGLPAGEMLSEVSEVEGARSSLGRGWDMGTWRNDGNYMRLPSRVLESGTRWWAKEKSETRISAQSGRAERVERVAMRSRTTLPGTNIYTVFTLLSRPFTLSPLHEELP